MCNFIFSIKPNVMDKTKVLIVEDHAIFREGLKKVIEAMSGVELVGEAENGAQFLELIKRRRLILF